MNKHRLETDRTYAISYFKPAAHTYPGQKIVWQQALSRMLTFVRALENLEKKELLAVHHTTEGNDYISLTPLGIERLDLQQGQVEDDVPALPHPRSATKAV